MKSKMTASQLKKNELKNNVLHSVYCAGPISIPELADTTRFSIPIVTAIVKELVNEKWIQSEGISSESKAGRKAKLFSMHKASRFVLVIEIDILFVRIVLVNAGNEIVVESRKEILLKNDPSAIDYLIEESEKIVRENKIKTKEIIGVGISIPGLVNPYERKAYSYFQFTGNPLLHKFSEKYNVTVLIENDLKAMTEGEFRYGKLKGIDHAMVINADYGVGVGLLLNGEVYRGASGFSGELGHIQVKSDGELCYCGKRGCLETVVSSPKIIERAKKFLAEGDSILNTIVSNNLRNVTLENIIKAAEAGDEKVIDLLSETGYELGRGIAVAVHLLNPRRVIIGGGLAKAGRFILHPVEEALNKYCISTIRNDLKIELSELESNSKIFGMYSMVMEKVILGNQY